MRKPLVMGNWKLNGTKESVTSLVNALKEPAAQSPSVEVAVCAPAIFIGLVESLAKDTAIKYGSEDVDVHTKGAFTGENSPEMIKEFGCKYAIVGHSERREIFKEDNEIIAKKMKAAYRNQLKPVLCVGETEAERKQGATNTKIEGQLKSALAGISAEQAKLLTVAYEPIWAIGTGNTATAQDAQEVCLFIRKQLNEIVGEEVARHIRILYGGSVKDTNAAQFCINGIDGVLVGGASLKVESFAKIVRSF